MNNEPPLSLPPNPTPEDLRAQGRAYAARRNSANYRIRTRRQLAALERGKNFVAASRKGAAVQNAK